MNPASEAERDLLLNAYLDGELDPLAAAAFERRLAAEPDTAAALQRLAGLGRRLRADRAGDVAPPSLHARLAAFSRPAQPAPAARARPAWPALAAAALVGVLIGAAASLGIGWLQRGNAVAEALVVDHLRAMMAASPVDVASGDRHTVKPWFDGKLAFAAEVPDLAADGFPLVGGRIEFIDGQPVPALVYRRNQHLITLTEIAAPVPPTLPDRARGFLLRRWSDGGLSYWAVSDVGADDLDAFARLFRAAVGAGR